MRFTNSNHSFTGKGIDDLSLNIEARVAADRPLHVIENNLMKG